MYHHKRSYDDLTLTFLWP